MTNTDIPLNCNSNVNAPFLLSPIGKDYIWGGNRLNDDYGKSIDICPLAETWECSTHPAGLSVVSSGEFLGTSLREVLKKHPDFLGEHFKTLEELPILIKLIDAKKDLSIQVHPSDEYARINENGQRGKTEMWYVLDATKDAKIVYGFHHTTNKNTIKKSITDGSIVHYLQYIGIKANDVFLIDAGTVHAIGAGALIAEIQENSDLTYRLYDYDRVDNDGEKRKLHIDKALAVANLSQSSEPIQPMRVLKYNPGCASELLCRCKYFQVERLLINTERQRKFVTYATNNLSFQILLCIEGCGTVLFGKGESLQFFKGDCIFVPANSLEIKIHGRTKFLKVTC